ncbi:hypothetical protein EVAR_3132_1 [Eumeta japonica]|uniref:Uncharacterized protein n=1 Tax=Eumeta variegata TaxID=151549 RepID=A0A4C1XH55_EUMVA|nr:hypothetical protein EVAR_3132_1 [Eumeta japonica]
MYIIFPETNYASLAKSCFGCKRPEGTIDSKFAALLLNEYLYVYIPKLPNNPNRVSTSTASKFDDFQQMVVSAGCPTNTGGGGLCCYESNDTARVCAREDQ